MNSAEHPIPLLISGSALILVRQWLAVIEDLVVRNCLCKRIGLPYNRRCSSLSPRPGSAQGWTVLVSEFRPFNNQNHPGKLKVNTLK
ncbi:hypothetical protein B9Z19DRAFT_452195 [Tuber borchii]|uniref:Uncharacterized protein n=1 Tax=Tuber borchii TaxID=42251 RepID=A0A2T6ZG65_TUBBO|nr:hypothetical protein B9Z19DRAFT_452195 [Tuber borchii]